VFAGGALHAGHTVVLMDKWTPERMLQLIEKYRVTNSHMVPTQFHRLLALPDDVKATYDVSSLRHMVPRRRAVPARDQASDDRVVGPGDRRVLRRQRGRRDDRVRRRVFKKAGTVGQPWPISEVVVLDDAGNEVPQGEIGTVYMSMQTGNFEYYKDKEKTEENRRGKYFTVGDIGYLDEDGWLFLRDRKSDMIISGGANIYPAEIESVLLTQPKVGDAAVFGIPHEDWGEEVKAVIEPAPGVDPSPELADEILTFCGDKLARFKTPRSIDSSSRAARPERQAVQAQAPRPLLGRPERAI